MKHFCIPILLYIHVEHKYVIMFTGVLSPLGAMASTLLKYTHTHVHPDKCTLYMDNDILLQDYCDLDAIAMGFNALALGYQCVCIHGFPAIVSACTGVSPSECI